MPLKVNDRIVWITDDSLEYGVVKWIGQLPEGSEVVAGIEFVSSFDFIRSNASMYVRTYCTKILAELVQYHLQHHAVS